MLVKPFRSPSQLHTARLATNTACAIGYAAGTHSEPHSQTQIEGWGREGERERERKSERERESGRTRESERTREREGERERERERERKKERSAHYISSGL